MVKRMVTEDTSLHVIRSFRLPVFLIIAGVVISTLTFIITISLNVRELQRNFSHNAEIRFQAIERELSFYVAQTELVRQMFSASESVTKDEFEMFTAPIAQYPAFRGIAFIQDDKVIYSASGSGPRLLKRHIAALGREIKQDKPVIQTESFRGTKSLGIFLALQPPEEGVVLAVFDIGAMIQNTITKMPDQDNFSIFIYESKSQSPIYAYGEDEKADQLFQQAPELKNYTSIRRRSVYYYENEVTFDGQKLTVLLTPTSSYLSQAPGGLPWALLIGGLLLTGMAGFVTFNIVTQNMRVRREVAMKTAALSESEIRMRNIIEHAVDGLITIDEKGYIQSFNPACKHIFGYEAAEVIGCNISMLMPDPYQSAHDGYLKNYRNTGVARVIGIGREVEGKRKDGSVFPLDLSVSEVWIGEKRLFSGIVRDITSRRKADTERDQLIAELADSNVELERFAYVASHDLQEPLRMIRNFSELLENRYSAALEDDARKYLSISCDAAARMQTLIDDLLD